MNKIKVNKCFWLLVDSSNWSCPKILTLAKNLRILEALVDHGVGQHGGLTFESLVGLEA